MPSTDRVQQAIQAARAGRKAEARDLLLQVVEIDPRNEMAWMWLSGLVDSLEDRMIACENVLTINPANQKVRAYLADLQRQHATSVEKQNREDVESLLAEAQVHAGRNDIATALRLAREAVEKYDRHDDAWMLIGKISSDVDEQIAAFARALQLNPSKREAAAALEQARYLKANPLRAAAHLEQLGKFDEAIKAYEELAAKSRNSKEFDQIYKQIMRIEGLRTENIRFVAPSSSIARLTFAWPLLYLSLAFVQMGLNPFAHSQLYLWLGLPWVVVGSFLVSVSEIRSSHRIWQTLFSEQGDGSNTARLTTGTAGWFLILLPHLLLILDSLDRLGRLQIPPMPF